MRRPATATVLILGVALGATLPAAAQVSHPMSTSTFATYLVPAYEQCTSPTTAHQPPLAFPACTPVLPVGTGVTVGFGSRGPERCTVRASVNLRVHNVTFRAACAGIVDQATGLRFTGSLSATTTIRVTDTNCTPVGPCTAADVSLEDIPLAVPVTCSSGHCTGETSLNGILPGGKTANVQLFQPVIFQPDGTTPFAVSGAYIRGTSSAGPATGHPRNADRYAVSLVTAYDECTSTGPSPSHNPPISVPACQPPSISSSGPNGVRFGPKGVCSVRLTPTRGAFEPADVAIVVSCERLERSAGGNFSGNLMLSAIFRVTDTNCVTPGPCTLIDIPVPIVVPCGSAAPHLMGGKCYLQTTYNSTIPGALTYGSVISIADVALFDPDNNLFAVQGLFVP